MRKITLAHAAAAAATALFFGQAWAQQPGYRVGVGISDITGAAAEVGMFGYAQLNQKTAGIHQRLRARAFVVEQADGGKRVAIVVTDLGVVTQALQQAVLRKLQARYPGQYSADNLLLTATHTHAGPGGHSHYTLYNITILGFQAQTFEAMVDGIVEAVGQAHDSRAPGELRIAQGELTNASRNRSAPAFRANPATDRAAFPLEIDPLMTVVSLRRSGREIGALSLFPTHGTSMTNTNTLISGDNKGYAAYKWEHDAHGVRYRQAAAAAPGFVGAFAQTNAGDMSPNLNLKPGSGPTEDEFENTRLIGERQFDMAQALSTASAASQAAMQGGIDYRMRYVDMSRVAVQAPYTHDGQAHSTCPAALGTSFAAGSVEDGPGPSFIHEGQSNPFVAAVGGLVFPISDSLRKCQAPKEVFIPLGAMQPPWTPEVLPVQLIRLGDLYLGALPAELTIMSGYRIRRQLAQTLGTDVSRVLVVGYSNAYAGYVTTPEEYDVQDYEGGSTHFGRWTQPAYMQELDRLAHDMADKLPTASPLTPRDLSQSQFNFQTGVVLDSPVLGKAFGGIVTDALPDYARGQTAKVVFSTGHPKNNLRRNQTFLEVQRLVNGSWVPVADDGDWTTRYHWQRAGLSASTAEITWVIPSDAAAGSYRVVHYGDAKNVLGQIKPFTGYSRVFNVR